MQATSTGNMIEEALVGIYEENSKVIQDKIQEIFAVLDRICKFLITVSVTIITTTIIITTFTITTFTIITFTITTFTIITFTIITIIITMIIIIINTITTFTSSPHSPSSRSPSNHQHHQYHHAFHHHYILFLISYSVSAILERELREFKQALGLFYQDVQPLSPS